MPCLWDIITIDVTGNISMQSHVFIYMMSIKNSTMFNTSDGLIISDRLTEENTNHILTTTD